MADPKSISWNVELLSKTNVVKENGIFEIIKLCARYHVFIYFNFVYMYINFATNL